MLQLLQDRVSQSDTLPTVDPSDLQILDNWQKIAPILGRQSVATVTLEGST